MKTMSSDLIKIKGCNSSGGTIKRQKMGPKCDRIFKCLTLLFVLTTIAAVGVLIWREFYVHRRLKTCIDNDFDNSTALTSENLIRVYPHIFHMYDRWLRYENLILKGANLLMPVNDTFDDGRSCSFSCVNDFTTAARRRRQATSSSNVVHHACCISNMWFMTPDTMHNLNMIPREIVHALPFRQIFKVDNCSQAAGCSGCTCMHQMDLVTAVVYKFGYTKFTATSLNHVEIDLFYLPGCCKCVNTQVP